MATPDDADAQRSSMSPSLTDAQGSDLNDHLNTAFADRRSDPVSVMEEIAVWAREQNDPAVREWVQWNYPAVGPEDLAEPPPIEQAEQILAEHQMRDDNREPSRSTSGYHLRDHLNTVGAGAISFEQASTLGVELVHHFDSDEHPIFHTADGDIVYRDADTEDWSVVDSGRNGYRVDSGQFARVHQAYVSPDARVAPSATVHDTACVEPGARIGPHAYVGHHAHVGKDATIASYARAEAGAFVGAFASVHDGSRVGPGAIVGAGSRIGPTSNIGAGARLEQRTQIDAFDNVAAQSRTGTDRSRRYGKLHPGQVTHLVDRLAALDRD